MHYSDETIDVLARIPENKPCSYSKCMKSAITDLHTDYSECPY